MYDRSVCRSPLFTFKVPSSLFEVPTIHDLHIQSERLGTPDPVVAVFIAEPLGAVGETAAKSSGAPPSRRRRGRGGANRAREGVEKGGRAGFRGIWGGKWNERPFCGGS